MKWFNSRSLQSCPPSLDCTSGKIPLLPNTSSKYIVMNIDTALFKRSLFMSAISIGNFIKSGYRLSVSCLKTNLGDSKVTGGGSTFTGIGLQICIPSQLGSSWWSHECQISSWMVNQLKMDISLMDRTGQWSAKNRGYQFFQTLGGFRPALLR